MMLDTIAETLPKATGSTRDGDRPGTTGWWQLADHDRYLWEHLIEHLIAADRRDEAEAVAADLRWVEARLLRFGPAAPYLDLSLPRTPRTVRLRATLAPAIHLLTPTVPAEAVVDVLHSRVAHDPDWGPQVTALDDAYPRPRLVNRWTLPDLPGPALRRVLSGHTSEVNSVAISSDGTRLATAGRDGTVRIWDAATGIQQARLGHTEEVTAVAISPDGTLLATASSDGTVRIWDTSTGAQQAILTGHTEHTGSVRAVAISPDGTWLATGGRYGKVRIWDSATGAQQAELTGHTGLVRALAISPDGTWLATAGPDGTVRIWDTSSGTQQAELTGHTGWVHAVAISPDGTWLATAGRDGTVRIWDTATGTQQATLTGHAKEVTAVAISPDGTWLATASWDETVWIWDTATGTQQATLTRHTDRVTAVSISPDGTWLASASYDRTVRIWHASSYEPVASMRVDADMRCCAWLPDDAAVAVGGSAGLYLFSFSPASVTGRVEGFADVSAQREQTATRRSLSP